MFKAKLISDFNYYRLFRWGLLLTFAVITLNIFPLHVFGAPLWLILVLFMPFVLFYPLLSRFRKRFDETVKGDIIEMNGESIRIIDADKEVTEFLVKDLQKVTVRELYQIPGETFSSFFNELKGKQHKNFIIIEKNGERQRFDFVLDSYYAIEQIKKVISKWVKKGLTIERV